MGHDVFKFVFLAGLVAAELIRLPHRWRNSRDRKLGNIKDSRVNPVEVLLMMLASAGLWLMPLFYIFTHWLDFADYNLPRLAGYPGTLMLAAALVLLWRAHADLGSNWSATLEINRGHQLVTRGVYRSIRHPIYAAMWLMALAQALMLPNVLAGYAGLLTFMPLYLARVPREEAMLLEHFGHRYRNYMRRTGRVVPRL